MLPVIELFYSIQGEGRYVGTPSIFMRVSGCNLRCVFKGSICDTPYSSFNPEKSKYDNNEQIVNDILKHLDNNPRAHLVVTGGEPLLYQKELVEVFEQITKSYPDVIITIETNGSIVPNDELIHYVSLFSVSPKLSTSVNKDLTVLNKDQMERHKTSRINIEALVKLTTQCTRFKFVYSGPECIDEIFELYETITNLKAIDQETYDYIWSMLNEHTYLMPEGITKEQLDKVREECVEVCLNQGWNFTDRLHITIWGDKRGV